MFFLECELNYSKTVGYNQRNKMVYSGCSGQKRAGVSSDNESNQEMQCSASTMSCNVLHDLRLFTNVYKTIRLTYKVLYVHCLYHKGPVKDRFYTRLGRTMT